MYTVLWQKKKKQHWERINSTHLIEECLKRQKLEGEDENSVKIYTPDADDFVMTPDELKRFMQMNQHKKKERRRGRKPKSAAVSEEKVEPKSKGENLFYTVCWTDNKFRQHWDVLETGQQVMAYLHAHQIADDDALIFMPWAKEHAMDMDGFESYRKTHHYE